MSWCAMAGGSGIAKTYAADTSLSTVVTRDNTCIDAADGEFETIAAERHSIAVPLSRLKKLGCVRNAVVASLTGRGGACRTHLPKPGLPLVLSTATGIAAGRRAWRRSRSSSFENQSIGLRRRR